MLLRSCAAAAAPVAFPASARYKTPTAVGADRSPRSETSLKETTQTLASLGILAALLWEPTTATVRGVMKRYVMKAIVALFTTVLYTATAHAQGTLTATISLENDRVKSGNPVNVEFVLKNPSDTTLHVLTWLTPLEGIRGDIFSVTRDGEAVKYTGIRVKRGDPPASKYVSLSPKQEVTQTVDISEDYDLSVAGSYIIRLYTRLHDVSLSPGPRPRSGHVGQPLNTNTVDLVITGQASPPEAPSQPTRKTGPVSPASSICYQVNYAICHTNQVNVLAQACRTASMMASQAHYHLENCNNQRSRGLYRKWFGRFRASDYDSVTSIYHLIEYELNHTLINFHCDSIASRCEQGDYAYVFALDPYNIYICGAFWGSPVTGVDSQSETIIHEMSHFFGIDDVVYGVKESLALAAKDSQKARDNADNYEYYAGQVPSNCTPP